MSTVRLRIITIGAKLQRRPPSLRARPLQRRASASTVAWPLVIAAAMMLLGVALRIPAAFYTGPLVQRDFNAYIFQFLGGYSDITSLFIRDQLWNQPAPYFTYDLEYPVGIGAFSWLVNTLTTSMMAYYFISASILVLAGLVLVWLGRYVEDANPWLLALWPTLPLYVVLNWDMLALLPTVAALVLFRRNRDGWGALLLTLAIWIKFFPIALVPLVLTDRLLRHGWRRATAVGGIIGAASLLINAPFAIQLTSNGVTLRDGWLYFFRFNQQRPPQHWSANLWELLERFGLRPTTGQINLFSAGLLVLGIGAIVFLIYYAWRRGAHFGHDLLLPAALATIGWWFFINKVYSCQYSLWIGVLLALLIARSTVGVGLATIFAGADLMYCTSIFTEFYLGSSGQEQAAAWAYEQLVWSTTLAREVLILVIIGWALRRLIQPAITRADDLAHGQASG